MFWKIFLTSLIIALVGCAILWIIRFQKSLIKLSEIYATKELVTAFLPNDGELIPYDCYILDKCKNRELDFNAYNATLGNIVITWYEDRYIITLH